MIEGMNYIGQTPGWICPTCHRVNAPWVPHCMGAHNANTHPWGHAPSPSAYELDRCSKCGALRHNPNSGCIGDDPVVTSSEAGP